jgi:MFS family permease
VRILYTITLFFCSALLFLVEPMVAKMILPTFGGSPAVWNASMMFFQAVLLLGYLYAHLSTRFLGPRRQALMHLVLMLAAFLVLPIAIPNWTPEGSKNPTLLLLALLAVGVGLPFFILSAGAPLIQKWFADTDDPDARDPYFLYRASNLGSLIGLLGYPLIYERDLTLKEQNQFWFFAYIGLVFLIGAAVALLWRSPKPVVQPEETAEPDPGVTWPMRLKWIALSAVPSSLMLGVTMYLTTNLTPIPLLWVVPLALYLITFVIAFSKKPWLSGSLLARILPLIVTPMLVAIVLESADFFVELSIAHLVMFFVAALMCHTLLAGSRPHPKHLTEFYLWISVGGMLGGVFNALLAPVVFSTVAEYPIAIIAACLLRPKRTPAPSRSHWDFTYPLLVGLLTLALILVFMALNWGPSRERTLITVGLPAILAFVAVDYRVRYGLSIAALLLVAGITHVNAPGTVLLTERSFFGVHRVLDQGDGKRRYVHGNTTHGLQDLTPGEDTVPLTYYYPTGPIGQVFETFKGPKAKKEVALVGLGIGSLSAYGEPGQQYTFFEIDPDVLWIARDSGMFTYLQRSKAQIRYVLGDARLMMAKEPDHRFGLIVLDAFSSDSIPVHLLTTEALAMYVDKLAPGGIISFHISNRYLNLRGVLANAAAEQGLKFLCRDDSNSDQWPADELRVGKSPSRWVVMARKDADFGPLRDDPEWHEFYRAKEAPTWTDDYSNILSVFGKG